MKVAIPRFEEMVAPCYEYSATIAVFTLDGSEVASQVDFRLESRNVFDRLRLLRNQLVDVLICGGVQNTFEDMLKASGVHVILSLHCLPALQADLPHGRGPRPGDPPVALAAGRGQAPQGR